MVADPGAAARAALLLVTGAVVIADRELALDLAAVAIAGGLLYLGARHVLAGPPGRLAGAALVSLAVAVTVASGGPEHVPPAVAAAESPPAATPAAQRSAPRDKPTRRATSGSPRICFASKAGCRAAAEGAAIPADAVVTTLRDGRVCVRSR